jgi:hypothetical protein
VPQPLGKFQHTVAEKEDVFKLLKSINDRLANAGGEPIDIAVLTESFEIYWPKLEGKLKAAEGIGDSVEKPREDREILLEILETVRNQHRIIGSALRANVPGFSWAAPVGTDSYFRVTLPYISDELIAKIFAEIHKNYPNPGMGMTSDTIGDISNINLFFKEPITSSAVLGIVGIIEKMAGVTGLDAKIMKPTIRVPA